MLSGDRVDHWSRRVRMTGVAGMWRSSPNVLHLPLRRDLLAEPQRTDERFGGPLL